MFVLKIIMKIFHLHFIDNKKMFFLLKDNLETDTVYMNRMYMYQTSKRVFNITNCMSSR